MPTNILMPALSPTMTEGTLARWLKQEGETITAGDVIAEIETDKATMEVEAVDEGVLGRILVPGGSANVAVNAPIAILVETRRSRPPRSRPLRSRPPPKPPHRRPPPRRHPRQTPQFPPRRQAPPTAPSTTLHRPRPRPPNTASSPPPWPAASRATPASTWPPSRAPAPRAASSAPISSAPPPRQSPPSPPRRHPAHCAGPRCAGHHSPPPPRPALLDAQDHRPPPHRVEADRPHFYLTADLRLDALLKLRADLNARSPKEGPAAFKLSVNDLLIKAAAVALREVPDCNASYTDAGIAFYDDIDIAVAVATPGGLITPIIRQADRKGIVAVSLEMKDLAARAKANRLKPEEFQGGGFSISNLGMYGVTSFSAIINPPQGAILAIGAGEQRPVVTDGALAIATMMSCTLSVDHRVIDGALGAQWLQSFRAVVEAPLGILL